MIGSYLAFVFDSDGRSVMMRVRDRQGYRVEVLGPPTPDDLTWEDVTKARSKRIAAWRTA